MKIFKLPDLGEGLQEAEIVEWHVKQGDEIGIDQLLVSVETAKAIVDIPSPYAGRIERVFGKTGETVHLGAPLVGFEGQEADSGTVVGKVHVGHQVLEEAGAGAGAGISAERAASAIRATPAVRALAHRLGVDLSVVTPSGPDGLVTTQDVQRVAKLFEELGPAEPLRGVRRAMAQNMTLAQREVAAATIIDDADIHAWKAGADITIRLVRALVAGCGAAPELNAWYDSQAAARRLLKKIDVGIAIDTAEGLFVPVLRDAANRDAADLRRGLDRIRADVNARRIPLEDLRGNTITLSNFGMIGARYAAPIILPPTVAILGAGRITEQVVAVAGVPAVHRILPLSLTFDHRTVTGGEAARFLNAVIGDLQLAT
ncbi:MAG: dihydrolipoamide acetyltransferase family protein [Sterolibacterium sp.]